MNPVYRYVNPVRLVVVKKRYNSRDEIYKFDFNPFSWY